MNYVVIKFIKGNIFTFCIFSTFIQLIWQRVNELKVKKKKEKHLYMRLQWESLYSLLATYSCNHN